MDSEMIIETAALMLEADKTENEDEARRLMDKLDGREVALVHVAYKLLSGKPFRVNSDNERVYLPFFELAQAIGAMFERTESGVIFYPPIRH